MGVGGEAEEAHAAGVIERDAAGFESAQIGDRDRQHIGELLRLVATRAVHDTSIGDHDRLCKSLGHERGSDFCR